VVSVIIHLLEITSLLFILDHTRIHTAEKLYKCDVSKIAFADLLKHVRIHAGEKPYKSDVCDQTVAVQAMLLRYIQLINLANMTCKRLGVGCVCTRDTFISP
jgi:hypothetical protein